MFYNHDRHHHAGLGTAHATEDFHNLYQMHPTIKNSSPPPQASSPPPLPPPPPPPLLSKTLSPLKSTGQQPSQTCSLTPATPITPPTSTFLTSSTATVASRQQQSPRTIAKPIARRPVNAANPGAGNGGSLHNSTLLALAAAAAAAASPANPSSGRPASRGGGGISAANNANDSGGGSPPSLVNSAISSSSAPGNYNINCLTEINYNIQRVYNLLVYNIIIIIIIQLYYRLPLYCSGQRQTGKMINYLNFV